MTRRRWFSWLSLMLAIAAAPAGASEPNPRIDMDGFLVAATEVAVLREARRVDEDAWLRMMREPGTVVLDARSREMYQRRHVEGAVSLPFPDFTAETLAAAIPDRDSRVLIYCNNNFADDGAAFPLKTPAAALNLSTFVALTSYGYRNVIELAPTTDTTRTRIPLVPAIR